MLHETTLSSHHLIFVLLVIGPEVCSASAARKLTTYAHELTHELQGPGP